MTQRSDPDFGQLMIELHDALDTEKLVRFKRLGGARGKIVEIRGALGDYQCRVWLVDQNKYVNAFAGDLEVIND